MSKGLNRWEGIGNLCADPDVKYMASGDAVAKINLACNDSYKKKDSGEAVETTEFIRIVFFRGLAKVVTDYLKKGSKIFVSGKLTIKKYQDSNGVDKWATEIVADNMSMLDSRSDSAAQTPLHQDKTNGYRPQSQAQPQGGMDGFDDDIPF